MGPFALVNGEQKFPRAFLLVNHCQRSKHVPSCLSIGLLKKYLVISSPQSKTRRMTERKLQNKLVFSGDESEISVRSDSDQQDDGSSLNDTSDQDDDSSEVSVRSEDDTAMCISGRAKK